MPKVIRLQSITIVQRLQTLNHTQIQKLYTPLSQQSCLVFESQEHCYAASITCSPKRTKKVNEGIFLCKLHVNFNSHLNLSSPLLQTIQHKDGPTKINYKGGVKDVRHNRAHHRSGNNRLKTAPIELVDSSQSSSSDKR